MGLRFEEYFFLWEKEGRGCEFWLYAYCDGDSG